MKLSSTAIRRLCGSLVIVVLSTNSAWSAEFGRTEGKFEVLPTGGAGYKIPIWMPEGPRGLHPDFSLAYDSQLKSGNAGIGWTLLGIQSIERCAKNAAQDGGEIAEVTLSMNDRFCINGNRLRPTSGSSTYGQPSSTYQVELQQFMSITASATTAGNGPRSFTAKGKNGWTYEFGTTDNARVFLGHPPYQPTTPNKWMLNKITDRNQNTMVITYQSGGGTAVPTKIEWAPTFNGSTSYLYSAEFVWDLETSSNVLRAFIGTYALVDPYRLNSITIKHSGTIVRKYVPAYTPGAATQVTRLSSFTECSDSAATNCLLPTSFSYQDGTPGLTPGTGTVPPGSGATTTTARDFNGDGRSDLLYWNGGNWLVAFANATGFGSPVNTGLSGFSLLGRFSPNGGDSFLVNVSGTLTSYRYNGSSFVSASTGISFPSGTPLSVDMNGDGLQDLVWLSGMNVMFRRNITAVAAGHPSFEATAQNGATIPSTRPPGTVSSPTIMTNYTAPWGLDRFDINGDGRQDLLARVTVASGMTGAPFMFFIKSRSSWFELDATSAWTPLAAKTFLEFNDDRCTDQFEARVIKIASCGGTIASTVAIPGSDTLRALLDYNGDGRTDVLGTGGYYRSLGNAFAPFASTGVSPTGTIVVIDQDGDTKSDLLSASGSSSAVYYTATASGSPPANATNVNALLTLVTDGFGNTTAISYVTTAQSNYSTGTPPPNHWVREADPQIVVSRAEFSYGMNSGQTYNLTYQYTGARYDNVWQRFGGFEKISATDSRDNTVRDVGYEQAFPLWMFPKYEERRQSNGKIISRVDTVYDYPYVLASYGALYFVYPKTTTIKNYEVGGSKDGSLITTRVVENLNVNAAYGNIGQVKLTSTDNDSTSPYFGQQWVTTTDRTFQAADTSSWCVDLVTQVMVTKAAPGSTNVVRTTSYTPDVVAKCRFKEEIVEPASSAYKVFTAFQFDAFGNVSQMDVTGKKPNGSGGFVDMPLRTTTVGWDAYGIYPITEINPEFHSTSRTYYYDKGMLKDETDPNNLTTTWYYDAFGRETKVTRPDGTAHQTRYVDCSTSPSFCGNNRRGVIWHEELNGNGGVERADKDVVDQYGRSIERWSKNSNTTSGIDDYAITMSQFDAFGRVARNAAPCLTNYCGTQYWTDYTYDLSNRVTKIARPNSTTDATKVEQTFVFEGRTTKITDRLETDPPNGGRTTTKLLDVNGWVRQIRDPTGYGNNYTYDAAGSLLTVTDSNGTPLLSGVEYAYGVGAFQTKSTDADMGPWEWTYDSLGNMVAWKDAKNQTFTANFDRLSRPTSRTEPGNAVSWTWDTATNGKGSLASTQNTETAQTYSEEFFYDAKGRISRKRYALPVVGNFDYDYLYDDSTGKTGLLDTVEYPATTGVRLKLKYEYRSQQLTKIRDANSAASPFWEVAKVDALGDPSEENLGNGQITKTTRDAVNGQTKAINTGTAADPTAARGASYLYDPFGNVTQRQESKLSLTESFYYDTLDRLEHSTLQVGGGSASTNAQFGYQSNGNISSQFSGAITYDYATQWAGCNYYTHAQPHAVRKITSSGSSSIYCYDQNGNATSRGGHSISWTSNNYPSSINGAGSQNAAFNYGPQRQRWKMVYTRGTEIETTHYAGPALERVARPDGSLLYRHSISALGSTKAIVTRNGASGTDTVRYVLLDQQGSVDAFSEANGSVTRSSFTAFGDRRNASTWSGAPSQPERDAIDAISRDGYTYQTVLGALGLNHMNGRVQDAVSGRFLSADPYVFQPFDSQGYNRYSYVFNNPLTFTDPSGFRTETRTGQQCISLPMPYTQVTIRGPTVNEIVGGDLKRPPHNTDVTSALSPAPKFNFGPIVIGMQCIPYSYQVEVPDPPRATSWWDIVKTTAGVVADYVPVVGSIKGGYEAYKVITDPNATNAEKAIAAAGILPYGKLVKHAERGIKSVKKIVDKALRPEKGYLGSKKHGLGWTEGPATAKSLGKPQGQWGSQADLDYAASKAGTLAPGQGAFFDLPAGSKSVVHRTDGTTVPATRMFVRNNGTGTFHGYPSE